MATGVVARFDTRRGYGFVIPDDGGEDVFVHQNNIIMDGFRYLKPNERVSYEIEMGEKGMKAVQVQLLDARPAGDSPFAGGDRGDRPERGPRPERRDGPPRGRYEQRGAGPGRDDNGRGGRSDRKVERLISLLVEKGVLAPGELDAPAGQATGSMQG